MGTFICLHLRAGQVGPLLCVRIFTQHCLLFAVLLSMTKLTERMELNKPKLVSHKCNIGCALLKQCVHSVSTGEICHGELIYTKQSNANNSHNEVMKQWMCTNWQERAHSGERSVLCIWEHGQSDICIGHAAHTVIWPQKSGHSYVLRFVEQFKAVVKEVMVMWYRARFGLCNWYTLHMMPETTL